MARYYKVFLLLVCLLSAAACQEGREAGDLLGQWRRMGSDTQYVSFSGHIVMFHDLSPNRWVYGNFQQQGDSLMMQCGSIKGAKADTLMVEESFGFKPFENIRVRIDRVDSDRLTLSKDGQTWDFYLY